MNSSQTQNFSESSSSCYYWIDTTTTNTIPWELWNGTSIPISVDPFIVQPVIHIWPSEIPSMPIIEKKKKFRRLLRPLKEE